MSARTDLLASMADQALAQYGHDLVAGGEPIYPQWAKELQRLLEAHEQLVAVLRDVTDVLDAFGNLPDGMMHPSPWIERKAEEKIAAARAALTAAGAA